MLRLLLKISTYILAVIVLCALAYGVFAFMVRPSLAREWSPDQAVLPRVTFEGNTVTIKNIRNATYRSTTDYDVAYYDKTFSIDELESVWYAVEPFGDVPEGAGHTLVSFGFKGGEYVAVSVEIRKEKGESFSPIKGVLRQYELMYVVADERDVIKLRTNYRHDDVYLYPLKLTRVQMQEMFASMMMRAEKTAVEPEFYNTLTNSCATNIMAPLSEVRPGGVPWSYKIVLPTYSDEHLRDLGLIDPSLSIEELRAKYKINDKALEYADDPLFSQKIRE